MDPAGGRSPLVLLVELQAPRGENERAAATADFAAAVRELEGSVDGEVEYDLGSNGVLRAVAVRPEHAFDLARRLAERLFPRAVAVGWGGALEGRSGGASSPQEVAESAARDALGVARRSRSWVVVRGLGPKDDALLTALFDLMHAVRSGWTPRQAQLVALTRGNRQRDVARNLGVSPSVVSESLKAARAAALFRAEEGLLSYLTADGT